MPTDSPAGDTRILTPRPAPLVALLAAFAGLLALYFLVAGAIDDGSTAGLAGWLSRVTVGSAVGPKVALASALRRAAYIIAVLAAPFVFPGLCRVFADYGARFVGDSTAESVALLRIVTAGCLLASALWEDLPSLATLPDSLGRPMGVLGLLGGLPGIPALLRNETVLAGISWATRVLLALAMLGVRGRVTVPAAAIAYLIFGGLLRSYTKFFHTGLIPLWVLFYLSFFPTTDAWSVDKLIGLVVPEGVRERARRYGWARYGVLGILAVSYFAAGMSKLWNGGLGWADPDNLRTILALDGAQPMEFSFGLGLEVARGPALPLRAMGVSTLVLETAMIACLFSYRARRVLPVTMVAMHLGIFLVQNVLFFDLIVLVFAVYATWRTDRALPAPSRFWYGGALATEPPLSFGRPRPSRVFAGFAVAFLSAHAVGLELYPLTGMQMYSRRNTDGVVRYQSLVLVDEAGEERSAAPDEWVGALRDARHRFIVQRCFGSGSREACYDFLSAYGRYEADREGGEQLVAIEARDHRWAFLTEPDDPARGEVVGVVRVPLR